MFKCTVAAAGAGGGAATGVAAAAGAAAVAAAAARLIPSVINKYDIFNRKRQFLHQTVGLKSH